MFRVVYLTLIYCWSNVSYADDNSELEIIEVSAQKRLQNIQQVAIALTSLNQQQMQDLGIQDSYQLSGLSPNVLLSQNAGEGSPPAVNIRGVGLVDYNTSNTSPIAFYFDEAVNGSVSNQFSELFDIEHVEILRGPQGTLFGRNTSGGALLFFSNPPEDEFAAYVSAGLGSDAYQKIEAMLNLPLGEQSATRISAQYLDYDYSATNNLADAPQEGIRRNAVRWQYALNKEEFSLNLKLSAADWQGISQPYGHTGVYDLQSGGRCNLDMTTRGECADVFGFNDGSNNFRDVSVDNDSPHNSEQQGARLKLQWHISPTVSLSSITAYNDLDRQHQIHCDASSLDVCVGFFALDNSVFSQELRLTGELPDINWIAGLFLLREDLEQNNSIDLLRDFRFAGSASGAAQYFYHNQIEIESRAIFSQVDYNFTPQLILTAGLRYNNEEIDFLGDTDLNVPLDDDIDGFTFPFWSVTDNVDDNQWSGRLALSYQLSHNWMWYTSASSGFKSGGFNGGFLFTPDEAQKAGYGPETLYAYEVGTKADLWNKRARLALSAFYYDYHDQQVFINEPAVTANAPNLQLLQNVADSSIKGLEAQFEWQITPDLHINLAGGYIPTADFGQYIDPTGRDLTGNRLPFTPKLQLSMASHYQYFLAADKYLTLSILGRYQSEIYFDQNQSPYTRQDGYALWDTTLGYHNKNWRLTFNIKNIFDQNYDTLRFDLIDFLGLVNSNKGEGRRAQFEYSYAFGN